jgi:antibiotic biosynthesis monooxygenase (ABM) superfamily enzyme
MKTKMRLITSLKIWIIIYPSITMIFYFFGNLLSTMPLYQRTFLITIFLVPFVVFVGIPIVEKLIRQFQNEPHI